ADGEARAQAPAAPRVGPFQAGAQVVARVAAQRPGLGIAPGLDQHLRLRAVEATGKRRPLALARGAQAARARGDGGGRVPPVEPGRGRPTAQRVREDVQVAERALLDEGEGALEGGLVLARE